MIIFDYVTARLSPYGYLLPMKDLAEKALFLSLKSLSNILDIYGNINLFKGNRISTIYDTKIFSIS